MGDSAVDLDGVHALQKQLLDERYDQKSTLKHIELLRGKLSHVIERIDSPPSRIISHIKVYAENRPELFKDDPTCNRLLKELLRSCKTAIKKSSMSQSGDSSSPLAVFAAKTLYTSYCEEKHWPTDLLELYMEDSLGQRQWVDSVETIMFCKNLLYWTVSKDCDIVPRNPAPTEIRKISKPVSDNDDVKRVESGSHICGIVAIASDALAGDKNFNLSSKTQILESKAVDPLDWSESMNHDFADSDGDSSGDEEVLEESSGRAAEHPTALRVANAVHKGLTEISDRYTLNRYAAKAVIIDLLTLKSGHAAGRLQGQGTTSTSTILSSITSFCGLPEIRQLASYCLDRWLGNPAIVDHVKALLCQIAGSLEVAANGTTESTYSDTIDSAGSSEGYETLIESDMGVVREIVKLRFRLKASQLELFKSTLILIAKKGVPVAKLIMRCMIAAELHSGVSTVRGETVKLLQAILNARHAQVSDGMGGPGPSVEVSSSMKAARAAKQSGISTMIGEIFGELCYSILTNHSLDDEISARDKDGEGFALKEVPSVNPSSWTPVISRLLLDLLVRVLRSLEWARDLDYRAVLGGILGGPGSLAEASTAFKSSVERCGEGEGRGNSKGSRVHPLEWEVMIFFADVAIALQLAIASEVLIAERVLKDKQLQLPIWSSSSVSLGGGGSLTSSSSGGVGHMSGSGGKDSSSVTPLLGSGVGAGTGRGGAARGRGGGRGSSIASAPSSMFRGSAMRASAAGAMGGRAGKQLNGLPPSSAPTAALTTMTQSRGEGSAAAAKVSSEELDLRFQADRAVLCGKILGVQEGACVWLADLSGYFERRKAPEKEAPVKSSDSMDPDEGIRGKVDAVAVCGAGALAPRQRSPSVDDGGVTGGAGDGDTFTLWLEWLQKVCCLNHFGVSKIQMDFDKSSPCYVRDNGTVSSPLLRAAVRLLLNTAGSSTQLAMGISAIEALVHRGARSKGPSGASGILVADVEIVPTLFELSRITLVPPEGRKRKAPPLPFLAHKALYWRVSSLCFMLGCARPESLGVFLWTEYPPVKSLLLMAISSRFCSPVETMSEEQVGTKESDAAVMARYSAAAHVSQRPPPPVLKHLDSNRVELFVSGESVEARYGKVQDVEGALNRLEAALGEYLFGDVPAAVAAVPFEAVQSSGVGGVGVKRIRASVDEDLEIFKERERQGQRREQERGARAERAAARLHRDASRAPLSSDSSSALDALIMLSGASSTRQVIVENNAGSGSGPRVPLSTSDNDGERSSVIAGAKRPRSALIAEPDPPSSKESDVVEVAIAVPPFIIPSLSSKSAPPYRTDRGSVETSDLTVMRCVGLARPPPDDVIRAVKALSLKFGFGAKLRSCTEPDFITRAISGDVVVGADGVRDAGGEGHEVGGGSLDTVDGKVIASTSAVSAPMFRVSRSAVEVSSSWLIPAIAEDADAILKRIPNVACLHLLLLSTLRSYTRLNMYGIWNPDPFAPSSDPCSLEWSSSTLEVSRDNILYLEGSKQLVASLFSGQEHHTDVRFLTALTLKVQQLFHSSSPSQGQLREQRGLLKILLCDLQSDRADMRAAVRLVLAFLAPINAVYGDTDSGPLLPDPPSDPRVASSASSAPIALVLDPSAVPSVAEHAAERSPRSRLISEAIRSAFALGPTRVDFTSFLTAACSVHPAIIVPVSVPVLALSSAAVTQGKDRGPESGTGTVRALVVQAVGGAVAQETEPAVLLQLLRASQVHLDPALPENSSPPPATSTPQRILLELFVTRRLTAELLLASMMDSENVDFLFRMLSADIERVLTFSASADGCTVCAGGAEVTLTRRGDDKLETSIAMGADVLRMLLFIGLLIVRGSGSGGVGHFPDTPLPLSSPYCSFMQCASVMLSSSSAKDCKKLFLPLLANTLCALPPNTAPDAPHRPLLEAMVASSLLNLLVAAGGVSAGSGGPVPLTPSGFSTECLQLIVTALDTRLLSTLPDPPTAGSERDCWAALVKPLSAKKIEKIQSELQPLVLEVIASASSEVAETFASEGCVRDGNGTAPVRDLRSWALNSITLSHLFTLKELHCSPASLHPGSDCTLDPVTEGNQDVCVVMSEHQPVGEVADTPSIPPILLPSVDVSNARMMMFFEAGNTMGALRECSLLISLLGDAESSAVEIVNMKDGEEKDCRGEEEEEKVRMKLADQRVLCWAKKLSHTVCLLPRCWSRSSAVHAISSALLSHRREAVLFALALAGDTHPPPSSSGAVAEAPMGQAERSRWGVGALALTPLLSRDKGQALSAFQRGVAAFKSLPGSDGSVLFLLLRQVLSLLAGELAHRCGGQLVEALHSEARDRQHTHLQRNIKESKRMTAKLLFDISDFISLMIRDSSFEEGADTYRGARSEHRELYRLEGCAFSDPHRDLDSSAMEGGLPSDKEVLRAESEEFLQCLVRSDEVFARQWTHLSFYPT